MKATANIRINEIRPMVSPAELAAQFPMTEESNNTVLQSRNVIENILTRNDNRLLGIIGPCSIHDVDAALDYAGRFKSLSQKVQDKIYLLMRVYFEKPRTTIGWRGLIVDPLLNNTGDIQKGLEVSRSLLARLTSMGIPVATEVLDPIIPQYISDFVSWAAIGARTSESQTHRDMASGLSMPVGFKNGTDGGIVTAVDAMESARHPKSFIGINSDGRTGIFQTEGNPFVHLILRGGKNGPNYYEENIEEAERLMEQKNILPAVIIDCSHANSNKDYKKQARVFRQTLTMKGNGLKSLTGFMLESNIKPGNQKIPANLCDLKYGVSITDECLGWEETEELILEAYSQL